MCFLFDMLLNDRVCATDFTMKELMAFEYKNGFGIIGYGKVCSCAPMFNFVSG